MANFETHLKVGAISSAAFSSTVLAVGIVDPLKAVFIFFVGCLAGLLPDLDADKSTSIQWLFTMFALALGIILILTLPYSSLLVVWGIVLLSYALVMYVIKPVFESMTVHRGSMHSIIAVITYSLIGTYLMYLLKNDMNLAMLVGLSVAIGSFTHLILDEWHSVDLENRELKKSFGTAFKLTDSRYPISSLAQVLISLGIAWLLWLDSSSIIEVWQNWLNKLQSFSFFPSLNLW